MSNAISDDFIINNISGSNEQYTDLDAVPITLGASKGAPLMRLVNHGPINLRGRAQTDAYKITIG